MFFPSVGREDKAKQVQSFEGKAQSKLGMSGSRTGSAEEIKKMWHEKKWAKVPVGVGSRIIPTRRIRLQTSESRNKR